MVGPQTLRRGAFRELGYNKGNMDLTEVRCTLELSIEPIHILSAIVIFFALS